MHGNERPEENSKVFNLFLFLEQTAGTDSANFRGICVNNFAAVEDIVQADIFFYEIYLVAGSVIGELARSSGGKYSNAVRLLSVNSPVCYVYIINALFKAYHCLMVHLVINSSKGLTTNSDI